MERTKKFKKMMKKREDERAKLSREDLRKQIDTLELEHRALSFNLSVAMSVKKKIDDILGIC